MTAFFFDEDHPDLPFSFGQHLASKVIAAIQNIFPTPSLRILDGGLLHHLYCYQISDVSLETEKTSTSGLNVSTSGVTKSPNMAHYLAIICDLAETLCANPTSMKENEVQEFLARKSIWVIVLPNAPDFATNSVHESLEPLGAYLGFAKLDWHNPTHYQLFFESLFSNKAIDERGFYFRSDSERGSDEFEEDKHIASGYESRCQPIVLTTSEFYTAFPKLDPKLPISQRGLVSLDRFRGNEAGHRERVGKALALGRIKATDGFTHFEVSQPQGTQDFAVPEAKMTKYLLNLNHPEGGAKANFFVNSLAVAPEDWRFLADQFVQSARLAELYRLKVTGYGVMHGAIGLITGRNGKTATVEMGWKIAETGPAQLVTAYPTNIPDVSHLKAVNGRVPEINLSFEEKCASIHEMAHRQGVESGTFIKPPPMVLEEWGTIWDGACGFGWVALPSARTPFAKWILKNNLGYAAKPGVHIFSRLSSQSVVRNKAYADGYAEVLRANGIDSRSDSRLD